MTLKVFVDYIRKWRLISEIKRTRVHLQHHRVIMKMRFLHLSVKIHSNGDHHRVIGLLHNPQ